MKQKEESRKIHIHVNIRTQRDNNKDDTREETGKKNIEEGKGNKDGAHTYKGRPRKKKRRLKEGGVKPHGMSGYPGSTTRRTEDARHNNGRPMGENSNN